MTSNINLHPSEITDHFLYRLRAGAVMWGLTGLAFALGLGSLSINETNGDRRAHWLRTGMIGGGLAAAVMAYLAKENVVQRALIGLDAQDISAASRQQRYYEAMKPGSDALTLELPVEPWQPHLFDWGRLVSEPNRFPHVIVLGSTGDGKTTLAEWLHAGMEGEHIALHPHWQASDDPMDPSDFAYCRDVIGGGRNFPAIADYLAGLHEEMNNRANLTRTQLRSRPLLSVVIDELPAIAKNCSEGTTEAIISLLFEARKFRIRLMLLAQADSVKILGLEGQGAVRENLTYIRLGDYALDHARWLIKSKAADPALLEWLQAQAHPCMVEDSPAVIPTIRKGQNLGPDFLAASITNSEGVRAGDAAGFGANPEPGAGSVRTQMAEPVNPLQDRAPTASEPTNLFDPMVTDIDPDEWQRVVNLRQVGTRQDDIIEAVWGCKKGGGASYQAAREKYRAILKSAGLN